MKLREIVMLLGGMIGLLLFISYMFDFYQRTSELNLLKKDMYFDSLILQQQLELRAKDSLFEISTTRMDSLQNVTIIKRLGGKEKAEYLKTINEIQSIHRNDTAQ